MSVLGGRARDIRRRMLEAVYGGGEVTDTYGLVALEELGLGHPERMPYEPSGWRFLARGLRGRRITPDDVLLDYGCGKGRVVHLAARRYPFGRVIGVDISDELAAVARRNVERNRWHHRAGAVEIACVDATTYELPDDVTYVYMFNPFRGAVFAAVMDRIAASLDRRPRALTLLYGFPLEADAVAATGCFGPPEVRTAARRELQSTIHVYTSRTGAG